MVTCIGADKSGIAGVYAKVVYGGETVVRDEKGMTAKHAYCDQFSLS